MNTTRSTEKGGIALEAALVIPVFLIISIFAVSLTAKTLETDSVARTTAEEAARAASQQQTQKGAYNAALKVVEQASKSGNITCTNLDLSAVLEPGGTVTATITCTGKSQSLPGFPSKTVNKTQVATEIVDVYRSQS